ncbi:histidine ammonia-lyase [Pontibacter sp. BT310]|uniref:Histidine ammonia-lyase n=1 Tax=Pontibacter populi TaxID=890055 RepID=A0ABS6XDS7_9BACT|nr:MULTISPECIES: histidine ammonia-lyase [Pontibacter]MBJ6118432.1 histidine ammonia-lyase [Pontibacter sp. BT310]MBR0570860.1 histidine ammonia-lyase [Microvirga sp. STS03]MBW3365286.1 histidine ammonia-lyase [Pontibacter populi]
MSNVHHISGEHLSLERIQEIISGNYSLALSEDAEQRIQKCYDYLQDKMKQNEQSIYGINTGFGSLYKNKISNQDLEQLQRNLMMSHACGTGQEVPREVVKLMLLLKVQSLAYGHSGVQLQTVKRLIDFYNRDIYPIVYQQGSLGASGDLAPLAHLCLPLIGLGEVHFQGYKLESRHVLEMFSWQPIALKAKEGLALLNGTQFMSAYGVYNLLQARRLSAQADLIGALSLDGFDGRIEPFNELIHKVRPHKGQLQTAENFRNLLEGSELIVQDKVHVQDPYSFRCIPQVHGASKDALRYAEDVFLTEINSVTDNPNIFPDEDEIISGGNFHGQPLALALDFMAIAMAELGSISERRSYLLISGTRGLPDFLVAEPGLNSGFMITQYTAASIVSQNKQFCTPASIDTIPSSNGQEDHVSMGANAATKLYQVVQNVERVLAIELMHAAQAIDFRRPLKTSTVLEQLYSSFREVVPFVSTDRVLHDDIMKSIDFLRKYKLS